MVSSYTVFSIVIIIIIFNVIYYLITIIPSHHLLPQTPHPEFFAWLRQYNQPEIDYKAPDDCLVSVEDRVLSKERGDTEDSEYSAAFTLKEGGRQEICRFKDHMEHAKEASAIDWESEYDASTKIPEDYVADPPPPSKEELKARKPVVSTFPTEHSEQSKLAVEAERELRQSMCKIFPFENNWAGDGKKNSIYDASYVWPEAIVGSSPVAEREEEKNAMDLVRGECLVSPPYSLDTVSLCSLTYIFLLLPLHLNSLTSLTSHLSGPSFHAAHRAA